MALVSRTTVGLRFFGDDLEPDQLTASLGREPTSAATKGQVLIGNNTGIPRIAKTGKWLLSVEDRKPGDLDDQIQELFGALTADLSIWRELAVKYKPDLFVGLFLNRGNEMLDISAETFSLIASRGVSVMLDIYGRTAMNKNALDFLIRMIAIFPGLAEAFRETIEYWSPDGPPEIVTFADIGQKIVEEFDAISPDVKQALFHLMEEGMASDDEVLVSAVATGLIEGMIGHAESWDVFRLQLGPLSKAHADAWLSV